MPIDAYHPLLLLPAKMHQFATTTDAMEKTAGSLKTGDLWMIGDCLRTGAMLRAGLDATTTPTHRKLPRHTTPTIALAILLHRIARRQLMATLVPPLATRPTHRPRHLDAIATNAILPLQCAQLKRGRGLRHQGAFLLSGRAAPHRLPRSARNASLAVRRCHE